MEKQIRALIVDDYEVYRHGLRAVVESIPGFGISAEAENVRDALVHLQRETFDLLVVNLLLPGMSGLALVREIRRLKRHERILLVTVTADLAVAAEALFAGVNGIVLESDSRTILGAALKSVTKGERFISPTLPVASLDDMVRRHTQGAVSGPLGPLSLREREVFELFVRGFDNRKVARELCISAKTVESHRGHIFQKLDIHSMADLVRFAFSRKLVTCRPVVAEDERVEILG